MISYEIQKINRTFLGQQCLSIYCDDDIKSEFIKVIDNETILYVKNRKWRAKFQKIEFPFDVIAYATATRIRNKIFRGNILKHNVVFDLSIHQWIALIQFKQIMILARNMKSNALVGDFFDRFITFLFNNWEAHQSSEKNYCQFYQQIADAEGFLIDYILNMQVKEADIILTTLLSRVDKFPQEIGDLIVRLFSKAYIAGKIDTFWEFWDVIAERTVENLRLISSVDSRSFPEENILSVLFLKPFSGHDFSVLQTEIDAHTSSRITKLFGKIPTTKLSVSIFARYLRYTEKESFSDSLILLSERLSMTDYMKILSDPNTLYLLEGLLRKQLYPTNTSIRQNNVVGEHILRLFDMMVECGSAQAFFMRDDFVLPFSGDVK